MKPIKLELYLDYHERLINSTEKNLSKSKNKLHSAELNLSLKPQNQEEMKHWRSKMNGIYANNQMTFPDLMNIRKEHLAREVNNDEQHLIDIKKFIQKDKFIIQNQINSVFTRFKASLKNGNGFKNQTLQEKLAAEKRMAAEVNRNQLNRFMGKTKDNDHETPVILDTAIDTSYKEDTYYQIPFRSSTRDPETSERFKQKVVNMRRRSQIDELRKSKKFLSVLRETEANNHKVYDEHLLSLWEEEKEEEEKEEEEKEEEGLDTDRKINGKDETVIKVDTDAHENTVLTVRKNILRGSKISPLKSRQLPKKSRRQLDIEGSKKKDYTMNALAKLQKPSEIISHDIQEDEEEDYGSEDDDINSNDETDSKPIKLKENVVVKSLEDLAKPNPSDYEIDEKGNYANIYLYQNKNKRKNFENTGKPPAKFVEVDTSNDTWRSSARKLKS